jgi:hypothetical protein
MHKWSTIPLTIGSWPYPKISVFELDYSFFEILLVEEEKKMFLGIKFQIWIFDSFVNLIRLILDWNGLALESFLIFLRKVKNIFGVSKLDRFTIVNIHLFIKKTV